MNFISSIGPLNFRRANLNWEPLINRDDWTPRDNYNPKLKNIFNDTQIVVIAGPAIGKLTLAKYLFDFDKRNTALLSINTKQWPISKNVILTCPQGPHNHYQVRALIRQHMRDDQKVVIVHYGEVNVDEGLTDGKFEEMSEGIKHNIRLLRLTKKPFEPVKSNLKREVFQI